LAFPVFGRSGDGRFQRSAAQPQVLGHSSARPRHRSSSPGLDRSAIQPLWRSAAPSLGCFCVSPVQRSSARVLSGFPGRLVTLVLSGAHSSVAPALSGSDSQRSITVALGQSITPTRLLLSPSSAISRHSTARALRHTLVDPRRSAASAFGFFPALSFSYARPVQCSVPVLGRRGAWLIRHWPSPGAPR